MRLLGLSSHREGFALHMRCESVWSVFYWPHLPHYTKASPVSDSLRRQDQGAGDRPNFHCSAVGRL